MNIFDKVKSTCSYLTQLFCAKNSNKTNKTTPKKHTLKRRKINFNTSSDLKMILESETLILDKPNTEAKEDKNIEIINELKEKLKKAQEKNKELQKELRDIKKSKFKKERLSIVNQSKVNIKVNKIKKFEHLLENQCENLSIGKNIFHFSMNELISSPRIIANNNLNNSLISNSPLLNQENHNFNNNNLDVHDDFVVYVSNTGNKYHRAGCRFLRRHCKEVRYSYAVQHLIRCNFCM